MKLIVLFIIILIGSQNIYAQEDTALNSALKNMVHASLTSNPQELMRYISPRLIKAIGGEENALKLFQETLSGLKDDRHIKIDTVINSNKLVFF